MVFSRFICNKDQLFSFVNTHRYVQTQVCSFIFLPSEKNKGLEKFSLQRRKHKSGQLVDVGGGKGGIGGKGSMRGNLRATGTLVLSQLLGGEHSSGR